MKLLETQAQFEELWNQDATSTGKWIVYFTAKWCGPCRNIQVDEVDRVATAHGLTVWKCDIDVNDYTPGYCGVRSVPTFMCFTPKKIVSTLQSNQTENILKWIESLPKN